ncbi:piggyBac transposable element-derived protein 3-like [Diretmus argenteus]
MPSDQSAEAWSSRNFIVFQEVENQHFCLKKRTVVVPAHPAISDDEGSEVEDDDVADPDFIPPAHNLDTPGPSDMGPSAKRKCMQPAVEVLEDVDEDDNYDEDEDQPAPQAKRPTKQKKPAARPTTWKKVDLNNPALPEYQHSPPDVVDTPFQYFSRYFSPQVIEHITYQTNLYATQMDVNTTFTTTEDEVMTFVAILIYMGISELPSVDDYWAMDTRVPQVANLMSSKRFKMMKRFVHFNDNTQIPGTIDRFFKIRPLFSFLNTAFKSEPQTPKQSVDEVMVAYKGKTAGNLRQYIKNKPDKWGFKLFARASEDGFIHDMVLYQGKTTLEAHGVPLTPEQNAMGATSQIVSVLASTMSSSTTTAILSDNFFTSLEIVRYLKEKNCRYTGTARDNRISQPPLKSIKEMEKKAVPRGIYNHVTSDDEILALMWKHNKVVTLLSTDMGVEPMSVYRYCSDTKKKEQVSFPAVIKSYNANMGGIDKSGMLVHLYRTPLKSKKWYMWLFAYAIDISLTNAWLIYRRDCKALAVDGLPLKHFRIQVFKDASSTKPVTSRPRRSAAGSPTPPLLMSPTWNTKRQTCKYCSKKGDIKRSNVICLVCKVHLCIKPGHNCFVKYHEAVA